MAYATEIEYGRVTNIKFAPDKRVVITWEMSREEYDEIMDGMLVEFHRKEVEEHDTE
jgi:hypothetical protein